MPSQDPVRAFFDTRSYLERNAIIPVRARIAMELLTEVRGGRVLDLGCGDGAVSRPLLASQNHLTLVDFSANILASARAGAPAGSSIEFVQADILDYVADEPYDAVICVGVLAHAHSVEQVIARASDAVRPGGWCLLQTTDHASPTGRLLNAYYGLRRREGYALNTITLAELVSIARRQGLRQLQVRRYGLLWPGLGRLPFRWERRVEEIVGRHPLFSRLGCEVMVSFQKRVGS